MWKGTSVVQQGDLGQKPFLRYAVAGVLLAAVVVFSGARISSAIADGVVYLRAWMPSEELPQAAVEPTIEEEFFADASEQSGEQELLDKLFAQDQAITYTVAQSDTRWQVVRMRVTGYCPCAKCCGKFSDGITASNHRIGRGDTFVAADKFYPFGTEMVIPGYNGNQSVEVKDRGRVIKGNRLDVFFSSHKTAKKWGTRYLDVLVKVE